MGNIKRILVYVMRYKSLLIIPSIMMLLSIGLDMFNPILAQIVIDRIIKDKEFGLIGYTLGAMLLISLIRGTFNYVRNYLTEKLAENTGRDIRHDLFSHIQSLPFQFFDGMNTGELMSRMTGDIDSIRAVLAFGLMLFLENVFYFAISAVILFSLNWVLALVCLLTMPLIGFITIQLDKKMDEVYEKISDQAAALNTKAEENIAGVRLIKAFARENYEKKKFQIENTKNFELGKDEVVIRAKYYPIIETLGGLSLVFLLVAGGYAVIHDTITVGTLVAFTGYIWMLIWPMRMLGWLTSMLAQCNASASKIFNIMDTGVLIKSPDNPLKVEEIKGNVRFENVTFAYRDEPVLKDIFLDARAGQTIAIMGATGAGKTSVINLIGRYYDCTEGRILVDGVDVKKYDLAALRGSMAVVMQDTFLFSDTIESNIAFGNPNASKEEIVRAAKAAQAHEFIMEMPEGYDTIVGERGIGLSGGQKQRISLARALVKNPRILVLDDATSAVDMETEYKIQQSLKTIMKDRTTFIIAHRISSVRNADEIILLEDGRVIERGRHKDLLKKRGKYYELYMEQYKDFDEFLKGVV